MLSPSLASLPKDNEYLNIGICKYAKAHLLLIFLAFLQSSCVFILTFANALTWIIHVCIKTNKKQKQFPLYISYGLNLECSPQVVCSAEPCGR